MTRQLEDCDQLAALRGFTIVDRLSDNDLSASGKKPRPGFEAVLDAVQSGRAQVVVAWSLDRLTRNRRDTLRLIEVCQAAGATVALVRGSDLDMSTPAGRMVAGILAEVAKHEIDQKSDRQRRAQLQAALAGLRVGGRRPFGYEVDGETIRPDEAAAVRHGYESLLAGVPLAQVARDWNERGLSGQSSPWRGDSVRYVLRNPRYAGLRAYRGEVVAPATWGALVPEETWRAVQAILSDPARRHAPLGAKALLTGIALCGVCSGPIHAGGTTTGHRSYRCKNHYGHVGRRAKPVDDYISALAIARLAREDASELLMPASDAVDVAGLRVEHLALSRRLETLAEQFAEGDLTSAQLRAGSERLRARIGEIEQQMADAGRVSVLGPLIGAKDVKAVWDSLGTSRQRGVINTLLEIKLYPPGRGVRTFRRESVGTRWKHAGDWE